MPEAIVGKIYRSGLVPLQQTEFPGTRDRLATTADVQFTGNVEDVSLDGLGRHEQSRGDLLVGQSFREQVQYIELAIAQSAGARVIRRRQRRCTARSRCGNCSQAA